MSVVSENPGESLWLSLLQQSSTRTLAPDSTCIIFGGDSSVKRVVIEALCSQASNFEVDLDNLALASYSYFDLEDPLLESPVKINIWGIADRIAQGTSSIVQSSMNSHRVSVIILLDLSKPEDEVVSSLQSLLRQASEFLLKNSNYQPAESVTQARDLFIEYLTSVRSTRGAAVNSSATTSTESTEQAAALSSEARFELALKQFGAPTIVVGWRSGEASGDDFAVLKSAKELQGKLRLLCLEAGAALIYTNAAGVSSGNSLLRRYLLHRLYCDRLPFEALTIDEKIDATFVPSGFDTLDLISISTGERPSEKLSLRSYLSNAVTNNSQSDAILTTSNANNNQQPVVFQEIESEQDWLQGLHKFMSQIIDAGSQGSGTASAAAVNPLQQAGVVPGGLAATRKNSVHNLVLEKEKDKTVADGTKKPAITRKPSMIPVVSGEQNPQAFFASLMSNGGAAGAKK